MVLCRDFLLHGQNDSSEKGTEKQCSCQRCFMHLKVSRSPGRAEGGNGGSIDAHKAEEEDEEGSNDAPQHESPQHSGRRCQEGAVRQYRVKKWVA